MNILIIGSGGREHALAWKVAQSAQVEQIFVAPGNAGTETEAKTSNIAINSSDIPGLIKFAQTNNIGLTLVGPEIPLVAGIVDRFQAVGLVCFGPSQAAAKLEGSKSFMKTFLAQQQIPTARFASFRDPVKALAFACTLGFPVVVKADGLAAGKGVVMAQNEQEAKATLGGMLSGRDFGEAGRQVVVEEFLQGEEASFIVIAAGEQYLPLASAQDHKARDEGGQGPNTGGMGAYSPAPVINAVLHQRILQEVIEPTLAGMAKQGHPFTGFLYAGLMISSDGTPNVLEFNCRFGDPETQPILLRLRSDLVTLCQAALAGTLSTQKAVWDPRVSLGVVLASGGYPATYHKGDVISGLDQAMTDTKVFHAGTTQKKHNVLTSGGRVLCVCALADTIQKARRKAYDRVATIQWNDMIFRKDIGYRAMQREKNSIAPFF